MQKIIRPGDMPAVTGLSKSQCYRKAKRETTFPKPIKLGERASGWIAAEVDAWLASRVAQRDAQAA